MKTPLLPFISIAALCAMSLQTAPAQKISSLVNGRLRDDPKIEMVAPYDPNPDDPAKSKINDLLVYTFDGTSKSVPKKTIEIRNNGNQIVYPFLRGVNNTKLPSDPTKGLYDPYDLPNIEYRGYIGYKGGLRNDTYYYGLRPNDTIRVRVPLSCWDGGRMHILTEYQYLKPDKGTPNITSYDPKAEVMITDSDKGDGVIKDGVVMWYKSPVPVGPVNESPDQLLEWTFRDKAYLSQLPTAKEIPPGQLVTLVNYDVSYVDNLYLPLAMEALDVPLPQPPARKTQPYGWIGANYTAPKLRDKIEVFTSSTNNGLGTYFGGKGWPIFNMPNKDLKIPSGNSVFAESPLAAKVSKYDGTWYTLSSGGDKNTPWFLNIGGQGTASSGNLITLSTNKDYADKISKLTPGMTVIGHPPGGKANPIAQGTKVIKVNLSGTNTVPTTVQIDPPLQASQEGANFDFIRPVDDYASNAMMKIWYSWAQYYLDNITPPAKKTIQGTVKTGVPTLFFSSTQTGLIEGMSVSGTGLPNADASKFKGPVVILAVADDKKSVTLSQLPSVSVSGTFAFDPPQRLQSSPARGDLLKLSFDKDPVDPAPVKLARNPLEFSKQVYLIMAALSQVPKNPDPQVKTPYSIELMINVTGGNFGFMFEPNTLATTPGGIVITSAIRDKLKSVLRGVTDFTKYTEYSGTTRVWYPYPDQPRGNQTFNVYNLDPYVWFVHVILEFSGYGFSLDDDSADVGAGGETGGGTQLLLTIGDRPRGIPGPTKGTVTTDENPNQWSIQTVYGPVTGTGEWNPANKRVFDVNLADASNSTPIVITSPNHGLSNGDKVFVHDVKGNTNANTPTTGSKANVPWTVANATKDTFELAGSSGNAAYGGGGQWNRGPLPYITFTGSDIDGVYWRVKGDDSAGFQGANMEGPGVQKGKPIRVVQLGDSTIGQLAISGTLVTKGGKPLPPGKSYKWTFSGK